jgi:hypothetical protein
VSTPVIVFCVPLQGTYASFLDGNAVPHYRRGSPIAPLCGRKATREVAMHMMENFK